MDRLILQKAASYCAYQERTQDEVRQRLKAWGVVGDEAEELIAELITLNYLNEERFARTFAGGKFRVKKWGRLRIQQELSRRGLTDYAKQQALGEIEPEAYEQALRELLLKKLQLLQRTENDPLHQKIKLMRYALSKGYEHELARSLTEELLKDL